MSKKQFFFGIVLASLFGGLIALGGYSFFIKDNAQSFPIDDKANVKFTNFNLDTAGFTVPEGLNFVYAAEVATPAVVHIKSTMNAQSGTGNGQWEDMLKDFFGESPRQYRNPGSASGSGVIISPDGYIVTNNHVIEHSSNVEVTLNDNRKYSAKVIGTDPNTDLAVVKIDEQNLAHLKFGDSDQAKIGEWVLAVGNPFNLTSTVTAGIVSAKARNIHILQRQYGIESFIQTDAAVNPGNSGGALINLKGELIGVNTAIATPTGTYAGYSFAVPASLVSKVVGDLVEFGVVQRALLGVSIADVNDPRLEEENIKDLAGIYVMSVNDGSSAAEAGLQKGDIITEINDRPVNTVAQLQEMIARQRPGDEVQLTFKRNGKVKKSSATLKNMANNTQIVKRTGNIEVEGSLFTNITSDEKEKLSLDGGVQLSELGNGKWRDAGIKEGYIITSIDKRAITSTEDLVATLNQKKGGILIGGVYPNGEEAYYGLGW